VHNCGCGGCAKHGYWSAPHSVAAAALNIRLRWPQGNTETNRHGRRWLELQPLHATDSCAVLCSATDHVQPAPNGNGTMQHVTQHATCSRQRTHSVQPAAPQDGARGDCGQMPLGGLAPKGSPGEASAVLAGEGSAGRPCGADRKGRGRGAALTQCNATFVHSFPRESPQLFAPH
jgi:hypothetical protein